MSISRRAFNAFAFLILVTGSFCKSLHADGELIKKPDENHRTHRHSTTPYLLPDNHPLQPYLSSLFTNIYMFKSVDHFKLAGFTVTIGHRNLMVGAHPSVSGYLFKKFSDRQSQAMQLNNYVTRIKGAKIVRDCIEKHHFKHLVVPQKWLYLLPSRFSRGRLFKSYILIVEDMDIYGTEENLKLYYNMDIEVLTELCTLLHALGGCDAFPRNQPFTRSGKIAFIDTEHVGNMKDHFIKHIVPALNKELQAYAVALWEKLEDEQRDKKRR